MFIKITSFGILFKIKSIKKLTLVINSSGPYPSKTDGFSLNEFLFKNRLKAVSLLKMMKIDGPCVNFRKFDGKFMIDFFFRQGFP